jgi:death on curing protein
VKKWRWVRLDVAYAIHERQLTEHGGASGVLDRGRLEAALARPRNLAAYGRTDAAALAAAYAFGILKNHPFADGNKRTAWVCARLFLSRNGYQLQFDPADAVRTIEAVAAGDLTESMLGKWFRGRIVRH